MNCKISPRACPFQPACAFLTWSEPGHGNPIYLFTQKSAPVALLESQILAHKRPRLRAEGRLELALRIDVVRALHVHSQLLRAATSAATRRTPPVAKKMSG